MAVETLIVGTLDLSTIAGITSAEGILLEPPISGDLIELDFTPGGQWIPGVAEPYTFDVPLLFNAATAEAAMAQLRQVQALVDGVPRTITRRLVVGAATVDETCTGVCSAAVQIGWDLDVYSRVSCVLLIQALTGWVAV
jgi:hypothetical protein